MPRNSPGERPVSRKCWKRATEKGRSLAKESDGEAVFVQVGVVVGGALAEQVDVEDQRQGDGGMGGVKNAGVGVLGADAGLDVGDE